MASTAGSLVHRTPGSAATVVWHQHRIFDKRTTHKGIEFDVELRGNGKRKSQWIPGHDVDARIMRIFNAKSRSERSHLKEMAEFANQRHSQTIFVDSDVEDDGKEDDGDDVSVKSSDVRAGNCTAAQTPAALASTPRRSGRERQSSKKLKDFVTPIRSSRCLPVKVKCEDDNGWARAHSHSSQTPVTHFQSTPHLPHDDSYNFLTILSDESDCVSQMEWSEKRAKRRSTKVPDDTTSASPIRRKRLTAGAMCTPRSARVTQSGTRSSLMRASRGDVSRKSTRLTTEKANKQKDELISADSPVTVQRQAAKAKAKGGSFARKQRGRSVSRNEAGGESEACRSGVTRGASGSGSRESTSEARVSHEGRVSCESDKSILSDELSTVAMKEHVLLPPTAPQAVVSSTSASTSFATPTTPPARPRCRPQTPMSDKRIRTSTTKSGRKSVSRIEDGSFLYDVNAMAREDAEIQRRTKQEEARLRRKKQPDFNPTEFYQSRSLTLSVPASADEEQVSRRSNNSQRRLSTSHRPPSLREEDIEEAVLKQKRIGSVPVEIKGQQGENYVVEFSKGTALRVPAHVLKRHFPDQLNNLITQRSTRVRPVTPAPSLCSPNPYVMSPSTPRTPVQIQMFDSNPPSPADSVSSASGEYRRRPSVASLISDIEIFDGEDLTTESSAPQIAADGGSAVPISVQLVSDVVTSASAELEQNSLLLRETKVPESAVNGDVESLNGDQTIETVNEKAPIAAWNGVLHEKEVGKGTDDESAVKEAVDSVAHWQKIENHMREEPLPDLDLLSNGEAMLMEQL